MGTIELGGGAGNPPVGSTPLIVLPEITPSPGILVGTEGVVQVSDPIPLPEEVPIDGIILLETPAVPDYSGVNRLIELIDVQKIRGNDDILFYDSGTATYYHGDPHVIIDFPVDSVFGRTGDIVALYGDYAASQVTYIPTAPRVATDVQAAIDEIAVGYATDFLELDDTPSSYATHGGRFVAVNSAENALEFIIGSTILYDAVTDTYYLPTTFDGQTQNLGQEVFINCVDITGSGATSSNPKVFMVIGTNTTYNNFLNVTRPVAGDIPKGVPFGLNTTGVDPVTGKFKLVTYGYVNGVDTSAWTLGDLLWVDPVNPGEMTNVESAENPYAVGIVAIEDASNGSIFVSTIYPIGVATQNLAGITHQNYYFTGDVAAGAPTYYAAKLEDVGIVSSLTLQQTVDDDQTLALPSDFLDPVYPIPHTYHKGTYNGRVEAEVDDSGGNEQIFLEIYIADSAGNPIDSGIATEPIGDLGVTPLFTLDSGIRNMSAGLTYEIDIAGVLRAEVTVAANQRLRGHYLVSKIGTEGPTKTFSLYFGAAHNSFIRVPPLEFLTDIADVYVTTPVLNEVLKFNGGWWENAVVNAVEVVYDNSGSGLVAVDVKSALDELDSDIAAIEGDYVDLSTNQTVAGEKTWSNDAQFDAHITIESATAADPNSEIIYIHNTGGATGNYIGLRVDGYSVLGGFRINGVDTVNSLYKTSTGNMGFTTFDVNSDILFHGGSANELMRIEGTGNVGIGTATPETNLEINSTADAILRIVGGASDDAILQLWADRGDDPGDKWEFEADSPNNRLMLDDGNAFNVMTWQLGGNVGIGSNSPNAPLHVKRTGNLTMLLEGTLDANIRFDSGASLQKFLIGYDDSPEGFRIYDYQGTAGTRLFVESITGNIGIGTTTPLALLHLNGGVGSLATGIAFGDGDTGIYEALDGRFLITVEGVGFTFNTIGDAGFYTNNGGTMIKVGISTSTNPTFTYSSDPDTGMGRAGADQLSLIAGGLEGLRLDALTTPGEANIFINDNVGIGATPNSAIKLLIAGTGTVLQRIQTDDTVNSRVVTQYLIGASDGYDFGVNVDQDGDDNFTIRELGGLGTRFRLIRGGGSELYGIFHTNTIDELTPASGLTLSPIVYMTGLGSDDTEDHVVAIDDGTGLLTKRSVSSIASSGLYVDLTTVQTAAGAKTWSDDATFSSDVLLSATSVLKFGPWTNISGAFNMSIGIEVNTSLIGGLDFKNSNTAGQVRFLARNDEDDYLVINVFGSTASGTIFGLARTQTHAIFGTGFTDTDKKLAIGTFHAGDLILGTSDTERMRILATGNVGVGTSAPTKNFHVYAATGNATGYFETDDESGYANFKFDAGATNASSWAIGTGGTTAPRFANTFYFSSDDGATDRMVIDGDTGYVGINIEAPLALLHLNGGVGTLDTGLTFGDGDSGIYEHLDDQIAFYVGGSRWMITSSLFGGTSTGMANMRFSSASATTPGFTFDADLDTGVGRAAANQLSLIAGGVEAARFEATQITLNNRTGVDELLFSAGITPATEPGGLVWWNDAEYTLNIATGLGPVLQAGQEIYLIIYNDTGGQLDNGTVLRPKAAFLTGGILVPTVQKTNSSTWLGVEGTIMVATMDIPDGQVGVATRFGKVRGLDASGTPYTETWVAGDQLYVSETDGELTNVRPEFPSYNISVGGVVDNSGGTAGEIFVSLTRNFNNTFDNFWNGTIRESFTFEITESGGTVTGTLDTQETGNDYLTYLFEDGFYLQDVSTPPTITLTPGTDTVPVTNYVYILESTKVLTVSTSSWASAEHIKVAQIVLQSAATTGTEGALRNQNWNDHIQGTDGQGHLSHIGAKLRKFEAQWDSGTQGASTVDAVPTPDDVWVTVTSGSTFQMHEQIFPAFDTETGDVVFVPNHFTTPYLSTSNLNVLLADAQGNSLNNTSFSFVLWGVQNSGSEPCQLMINLPWDSYAFASPDTAVNDALNYAVYTIPAQFAGVGFLIARFTYTYKNNAWVLYDTEDLRGRVPNTTAGGGGGGAGVTEFTALNDTPGSYVGEALSLLQVNAGETALEYTTAPTVVTLYFNDTNTYITEDGSGNLTFVDAVAGTYTLAGITGGSFVNLTTAQTVAGVKTWSDNAIFNGNVGIGITPTAALHINGGVGSLATGLAFGDGDTGFFEQSDDLIYFQAAGTSYFYFSGNGILANSTSGGGMKASGASAINPTLNPRRGDNDTGIGWASSDQLSLIVGGVEGVNIDGLTTPGRVDSTFDGFITMRGLLRVEGEATPDYFTFRTNNSSADGRAVFAIDPRSSVDAALWIMPDQAANLNATVEVLNSNDNSVSTTKRFGLTSKADQALIWSSSKAGADAGQQINFTTLGRSGAIQMTLYTDGKLGIGIDPPTVTLHVVGDAIITALPSDDTEDHLVAIDDSTGVMSKRSVASLGAVAWGTATGKYVVLGSASGDIESSSTLAFNSGNSLAINTGDATSTYIRLYYDGDNDLQLYANGGGNITSAGHLNIFPSTTNNGRITFGTIGDAATYVKIKDVDTITPFTYTFKVSNSYSNDTFVIADEGEIYMPELASDDTEDHIVAIDDATGLLTKRSVASIVGTSAWNVAANLITPAVSGDDVRLAFGEVLYFGDSGTSYIQADAAGASPSIAIYDGGVRVWASQATYVTHYIHQRPSLTDSWDFGTTSLWWRNLYAQTYYVDDATAYISYSGTELQFTDGVSGTQALSDLLSGGEWTSDTNGITYISGNVGIGAASSATAELYVADNSSTDHVVHIYANSSRGASRYALHIDDNDGNSRGSVYIQTASGIPLYLRGPDPIFKIENNGTSGTEPAEILFQLHDSTTDYKTRIVSKRDGTAYGTQMGFWTRPDTVGDTVVEQMSILSTGQVTVGNGDYSSGDVILRINSDRPWAFYQLLADASASMNFGDFSNSKWFHIREYHATITSAAAVASFYGQQGAGYVYLYFAGSLRFQTTTEGITVTQNTATAGTGPKVRLYNSNTDQATGAYAGWIEFYKADASTQGLGAVSYIRSVAIDSGGTYNLAFGTGQDVVTPAGDNGFMTWTYQSNLLLNQVAVTAVEGQITLDTSSAYSGKGVIIDRAGFTGIKLYDGSTGNMYIFNNRNTSSFGNIYLQTGSTPSNRLTVYYDGKIGINDSTPSYPLDVNGTARFVGRVYANAGLSLGDGDRLYLGNGDDYEIYFDSAHLYIDDNGVTGGADIKFSTGGSSRFTFDMDTYKGTAVDWIATSDIRLKTNIQPFYVDMDKVKILADKAVRFNWKEGVGPVDSPEIGFIAQDVERIYPEFVNIYKERPHYRALSYNKMVTLSIVAVSQVKSEVDQLKERVAELEDEVNTLKNG